jgi:hypothetical protein
VSLHPLTESCRCPDRLRCESQSLARSVKSSDIDGSARLKNRRRHASAQLILKNVSPGGSNSSVSSLHRCSNLRLAPESPAVYSWPAVVRSCRRPIAASVAIVEAVPLESRETFYTCNNTRMRLAGIRSSSWRICLKGRNDEIFTTQYMFQDVSYLLI